MKKDNEQTPGESPGQEPDLGAPDFSSFMDDDTIEIGEHHVNDKKESAKQKSMPVGEVIAMTTGMLFSFVASRKGEHWMLTPDEGEQIAETSQQCVDAYMPSFEMSPIWLLAGITTGIVAPRLLLDMHIQSKEEKAEGNDDAGQQAPEPETK